METVITTNRKNFLIALFIVFVCFINTEAQNLITSPECVSYDILNNRYLVSCFYAGKIIAIDSNGGQSVFKSGLGYAYSNTIYGNTLYVSTMKTVKGYDLTSGAEVMSVYIPTSHQLDGMTVDTNGNLYIVDFHYSGTNDQIFKIKINSQSYSTFVPTGCGLVRMPQDLFYDKPNNRLIVVSATTNGPIQAINLSDSSITNILATTSGSFDGIEMDLMGNYYLSNWDLKTVVKFDHNFANPPVTIYTGQKEPSNLGYNKKKNVLAVPFFNADTVIFLQLGNTGIVNKISETASEYKLFQNYPNPFNPVTKIKFNVKSSSNVQIGIFDNTGKSIVELVNRDFISGCYSLDWNAEIFPSGVYYCRILINGKEKFSDVKKMILLK